jgi:hypothetical protein
MLKKKITFINSIKHILAEYDEQICFEISGTVDNMIMLTNMYTHLQSNC